MAWPAALNSLSTGRRIDGISTIESAAALPESAWAAKSICRLDHEQTLVSFSFVANLRTPSLDDIIVSQVDD